VTRTAILGIGSPHGDDRVGWLAIEALDETLPAAERAAAGVTTLALDRPGLALLAHLHGAQRAVLIDALAGDDEAGTVAVADAAQLRGAAGGLSTHDAGVAEALAMGEALGLLPPELTVVGIAVGSCLPGTASGAAASVAAGRVARRLARWLREGGDLRTTVLDATTD